MVTPAAPAGVIVYKAAGSRHLPLRLRQHVQPLPPAAMNENMSSEPVRYLPLSQSVSHTVR